MFQISATRLTLDLVVKGGCLVINFGTRLRRDIRTTRPNHLLPIEMTCVSFNCDGTGMTNNLFWADQDQKWSSPPN
jgi:hypothetical protein